jgi:glutamate carboxypeptidase
MEREALRLAAQQRSEVMINRLRELVECESPSDNVAALAQCADLLTRWGDRVLSRPARRLNIANFPHLLWRAPDPKVLLLGHFDTVWPIGTLAEWPMTIEHGIARGPGVFDMKAGIVQMFEAVEMVADRSKVSVFLTCDEETGSATSRELIEEEAALVNAVLLGEPSADGGAFKVARKGVSHYRVRVSGRAAHAGLEPEIGVNAVGEIAHQVLSVEALAALDVGTTVTPTVLMAGTTINTVPATATLDIDVRAWNGDELDRVDREIRRLAPHLAGAGLSVSGGINRYPLEVAASLPLVQIAEVAAKDVGLEPPKCVKSGGASDANFTAAVGIPTLDGLGAVGSHPHAREEWVDVNAMPDRVALLVAMVDRICAAAHIDKVSVVG